MAERRTHILVIALLVSCCGASALAQRAADRLAAAKSLKCAFTTMSTGDWKNGTPAIEIKPSTFTIGFDDIDTDDGTARVIGPFGPSDIVVRVSTGTLHFLQSFREGPLYATTIFPYETRPGRLRAVHTRHEFTEVSLPGFTSRPEQYVGDCEITR
jgi:hypothetical protein